MGHRPIFEKSITQISSNNQIDLSGFCIDQFEEKD
jgi:hypothetical protein